MTDSHKLKVDQISSTTETSLFYENFSAFNFKGAERETALEIPQKPKIPLIWSISSCSSSKDSAQQMEQLGLMKNSSTQILREQGGATAPQKSKFRSFDWLSHVAVQKIQLDEWNNMVWWKIVQLKF